MYGVLGMGSAIHIDRPHHSLLLVHFSRASPLRMFVYYLLIDPYLTLHPSPNRLNQIAFQLSD